MAAHQKYDDSIVLQWITLRNQGATPKEISEMFGGIPTSTIASAIKHRSSRLTPATQESVCTEATPVQPVKKEKTLDDFTPREIIQHMYGLGYRIDKDGLYQIEIKKNRVKLSDII